MTNVPFSDAQESHMGDGYPTSSDPLSSSPSWALHQQESPSSPHIPDRSRYVGSEPTGKRYRVRIEQNIVSNTSIREGSVPSWTRDHQAVLSSITRHIPSANSTNLRSDGPIESPTFPPRPRRQPRTTENQSPSLPLQVSREDAHSKSQPSDFIKGPLQSQARGSADLFPWSGDHVEDVLNEHSIQYGYYDKLQVNHNESSSARLSIWSSVKHKSGLPILSSLFVSALERRQDYGTVNLKSTFKPPPRVTLTDTKREAWLKDLADPATPLRRLSRTIPHGIRGRILLDHCLAKNIPIWRAIWLAKCVGANEIRAFKRKGASASFVSGGENKWIKEWTNNVEQFLESLAETCEASDWRPKITYALQLTVHLYAEHLLDQDHFIDWTITSLSESGMHSLPVWLLITRKYWKEFPVYRRRGRRLALALVEQLSKIHYQGLADASASLSKKLSTLITKYMLEHPSCFFFPDQWPKYACLLRTYAEKQAFDCQACFDRVSERNVLFLAKSSTNQTRDTQEHQLISLLDGLLGIFDIITVSEACLKISEDSEVLVCTIIRWATTRYRSGLSRIYIAIRLLRHWSDLGLDINRGILTFLKDNLSNTNFDHLLIHKLISELVHSRHFSVGKFLQWLMARGLHFQAAADQPNRGCAFDLLNNIPSYDLPEHILNLRTLILQPYKSLATPEQEIVEAVKVHLSAKSGLMICSDPIAGMDVISGAKLRALKSSTKFEISYWIRNALTSCIASQPRNIAQKYKMPASILSSEAFESLYTVLEKLEDFNVLADVVRIFINFSDQPLLVRLTEAVNLHFEVLYAIGVVDDLFHCLLQRLAEITARGLDEKQFLIALADLAQRLPRRRTLLTLRKELALCEPTSALAACSPVSESMAEALQSADSAFLEEVELLFSSGSSMDRPLLRRVFMDIVRRVEASWIEQDDIAYVLIELLSRLRFFDCEAFDSIIKEWLNGVFCSSTCPALACIIPPLVCSATMSLQSIIELFLTRKKGAASVSAKQLMELLDLYLSHASYQKVPRLYRLLTETRALFRERPDLVIAMIAPSVEQSAMYDQEHHSRAREVMSKPEFLNLLQEILIVSESTDIILQRSLSQSPHVLPAAEVLDHALGLEHCDDEFHRLRKIFRAVDEYNILLCRLRIGLLLTSNCPENLVTTFVHEALSSFHIHSSFWRRMLAGLPKQVLVQLHATIIDILLSTMSDVGDNSPNQMTNDDRLIVILIAIEPSTLFEEASATVSSTVEKLTQIYNFQQTRKAMPPFPYGISSSNTLNHRIAILLQLICIHRTALQESQTSQVLLSRLVLTLALILSTPVVEASIVLSTLVFDLLAVISDELSFETRLHCMQLVRDQYHLQDPRLSYLLGFSENEDSSSSLRLGIGESGSRSVPFSLRRFEMVQDATPVMSENDTSLSLNLFNARKAI